MNAQAKQLKLTTTNFMNPHGLPHADSKSTAIEVCHLCAECLKDELFKKIVKTEQYKCLVSKTKSKEKRIAKWTNTNKLLRR